MKPKQHRVILFSFFLLLIMLTPQAQAQINLDITKGGPSTFADIVEDLTPAVVNISSTQKTPDQDDMQGIPPYPDMPQFPEGHPFNDFFEEFFNRHTFPSPGQGLPVRPATSLGSGFVVDADNGYIITNGHVIKNADEVRVTFHDETTLTAEVIGTDDKTDIAVLKVKTDKKLNAVEFGNSDKMRVGDWVVAIGNPFGLGGTVTAGIISARQRDINSGPYDDYIQTDASINRGNSGGPMFNLDGQVIGINTAIFSPSGGSVGIGFAIPSSLAAPVINQIIEFGHTRRGWLGVRIQSVTEDIAESLGMDKPHGALVANVDSEGPSANSGIELGDVIIKFNDTAINEMRDLPRTVASTPVGSKAKVVVLRNGKEQTFTVEIGELEKMEQAAQTETEKQTEEQEPEGIDLSDTGIKLSEIDQTKRDLYGIDSSTTGALILSIEEGSKADNAGLFEGDVIMAINQKKVKSSDEAINILKAERKKAKNAPVLFLVSRQGEVRFIAIKLEK